MYNNTRKYRRPAMALAVTLASLSLLMPAKADNVDLKDPAVQKYINGSKWTGYLISTPETRAMNDDDEANPGFLWVDMGAEEWTKEDGAAGKSCASCHNEVESMKGVGVSYPKFDEKSGKMKSLEHQINICRKEQMQAEEWKWDSDELLGMTAVIKLQSRGMPINVSIDGPAAPFYEQGKAFFYQRRGQLDMACKHCHEDNAGNLIRADLLSQAQPNGFPTYRLKWQGLGSLHRRFKGCNDEVRAKPYKPGGDEYTNLELFLMDRAQGLPSEAPSVRR